MLSKALIAFLTLVGFCSAQESTDFGFEWQQRLSSLGLDDYNHTSSNCAQACAWLQKAVPDREVLPSDLQYFKVKNFFWSAQQGEVSPACFVIPANAADVSVIVKIAERTECPFAVKAGGHAAFAGGSNIEGGITIDLQLLNELTVSEDKQTTRVGPGNRWIDVYEFLTPKKLSVVGGRVAEIGVGGLILGGGISYFSGRYGWALDGVRNYEVVVASGEILNANKDSHPDLYWALRGGGNNFGVVTAFDLETFPQGDMYGGMSYHDIVHNATMMDALNDYAHNPDQDVDALAYIAFVWVKDYGVHTGVALLTHAQPGADPPALKNFTAIPAIQSTLRLSNMTDLALELNQSNPNGKRESFSTATYKMSREMLQELFDIYIEEVEAIKELEGIGPAFVLQVMTKDIIAAFARNGGNCLGLEEGEGPLLNLNFAVQWIDPADDELVLATAKRIVDRSVERSKELGLEHRYLYQNYAEKGQDVMASYGEENLKRLREISRRYDPEQVFQRLQPGYFKL